MSKIYGYCRISTSKQNIERQVRNIQAIYSDAIIVKEVFTGTKIRARKELDKLLKNIKKGDTIVFDSVSRMSRDCEEGFALYEELYNKEINLVFLKEPHINTDTYKKALSNSVQLTGTNVDFILEGVNKYLMSLAKEQIKIAFNQSEKEVADLHQRTKEGIETARLNGKQIGQTKGSKLITKKSIKAKEQIKKYNNTFGGSLTNEETWKLIEISKATFYKYKNEIIDEMEYKE
ncbi:MAG TPA: resolvase [Lachnospiraceae bacterium]|nr:resolvase [Lachnospiraceae bacterium]